MCPPAAVPLGDIGYNCTYEELFVSLERMISGTPPPGNVLSDINPYKYKPSHLPDGIWFLVKSKEDPKTQHGHWKAKGETREIFSNSAIIGWETTLEFYAEQVPHEHKTNWVMQEFTISQKKQYENIKAEDASALCRVFRSGEQSPNGKNQKMAIGGIASESHTNVLQSSFTNAENDTRQSSTSKQQLDDDDKARELADTERLPNLVVENLPQIDYISRGDYLELLDLVQPASPSSSSENSSCMTMSSDEYFDHVALLQDLEPESNQHVVQKDTGHMYTVSASQGPNEVLMFPAGPSLLSVEARESPAGRILKSDDQTSSSRVGNIDRDQKAGKQTVSGQQTGYVGEGPSSRSHNMAASSSNRKKPAVLPRTRGLRKYYFCFIPF